MGTVAMWAWNWTDSSELVAFAVAHRVTTVFAYVAPGFTDPTRVPPGWAGPAWPLVTSLASEAADHHLTLYAMGGDPSWVLDPAVAADWAAEALDTRLFGGLHLELEPWGLDQWTADRDRTIAQLLACLERVQAVARAHAVPLELSLPWWLHGHTDRDGTPLDLAAMHRADAVTVVTYFDSVEAIGGHAAVGLAHAASLHLPVRLAVLTYPVSTPGQSFAGTDPETFEAALARIDGDHAGTPNYLGVAVEDYWGWRELTGPGAGPVGDDDH
jgi:hypothetical protein